MKRSTIRKISFSLTPIIILLLVWLIISHLHTGDFLYPKITDIFKTIYLEFTLKNVTNYLYTLLRVVIACFVAITIATLIIILYLINRDLINLFTPLTVILKTVPFISISLFIILLFLSYKELGSIIISCILLVPISLETLKLGIDRIPQNINDDLATLDVGFVQKLFRVYFPLLAPYYLLVVLETFGLGFKVMIMAEYFIQLKNSVGIMIYNAKANLEMDKLIAFSLVVIVIVALNDIIIKRFNRKIKIDY